MSNSNNKYMTDSAVINLNCFLMLLACHGYLFTSHTSARDLKVPISTIAEIMSAGG